MTNTDSKKTLLFALIVGAAAVLLTAFAADAAGFHIWQQITEQQGVNGQVVCEWSCNAIGHDSHYIKTHGYGYCPRPY